MSAPLAAAVFASGGGTNLQSLLDHQTSAWRVAVVVSNRSDAGALQRGRRAGLPTAVVPTRERPHEDIARDTLEILSLHAVDVILLAGYMRLIPAEVVRRYRRRILNVHPALLPAFGGQGMYGRRVHDAVLAAGARVTGPTIHYADEEYDRGDIVAQWPVPVLADDTAETLSARVLAAEHRLYPAAVDHVCRALAQGREPGPLPLRADLWGLPPLPPSEPEEPSS